MKRDRSRNKQPIKGQSSIERTKSGLTSLTEYSTPSAKEFVGSRCVICLSDYEESEQGVIKMKECADHYFHKECLARLIGEGSFVKCPVCMNIYGVMQGDQPPGQMHVQVDKALACQGYPPGTIVISYSMKKGKRGTVTFPGTHRTAYLPDTEEGREVLKLLQLAFQRKLIFTVGRSITTGLDNQIVWNGIHHKTRVSGGSANFGYPDDSYFRRVKQELALKGIR